MKKYKFFAKKKSHHTKKITHFFLSIVSNAYIFIL